MRRPRSPGTDAAFEPPDLRRWVMLTGAAAVWPLAALWDGEALAVGAETASEMTVAAGPEEPQIPGSETTSSFLRGRIGEALLAPAALAPVEAGAGLDWTPAELPAPLSLPLASTASVSAQARRAWPPLPTPAARPAPSRTPDPVPDEAPREAAFTPPPITTEAPAAAPPRPTPSPEPAASRPSRSRAWPAVTRPVFTPAPLAEPVLLEPASFEVAPPMAAGPPAAPASPPRAPETNALETTAPETIEIVLTPPPPAAPAAEPTAPDPRPRAFPFIPPDEPDLSAFAPVVLPDGALGETLASAVQDALEQNPEIQIAEAQWQDAQFGIDEARAALLPSMELQAARGHERTHPEGGDLSDHSRSELSVSLRQNIYDFGAARGSMRSADRVAASAEWAYRAQVDEVALEIAQSFLQVLEQESIVALAERNLAAHERILETVRTQQEFGLVTGADVSRVEARLNAARADLLDQRSALEQARENYRRLLNREPGRLAEPARVEALIPPTADEAVALLDEANPQVLQARLLLASLEDQRDSLRAGYLPRFDLELSSAMRDDAGGPTGRNDESRAMINMRLPLFDGGAREASIGRIASRIRQAEFEVERAERDAEQAVRNDYSALTSAWEKVDAIEDEVAAAERLVSLYDEQFRQGSRNVFDLLDGQSTLYQAQVRRESNRTEMRISAYRVLRTLGRLFDTITTPPEAIPQLNRPAPAPRPVSETAPQDAPAATSPELTPTAAVIPPPPPQSEEEDAPILLPDADEPIAAGRRPAL